MPPKERRFTEPFWQLVGDRAAEITVNQRDGQDAPSQSPDVWNRRNTYRVGLPVRHHIPLELRLIGSEKSSVLPGRLTNLALGGIGFASAATLQVGSTVLISMPQGESRNTNFRADVIYSRQVGRRKLIFSGLEFTAMNPIEQDELRRLWTACQRIEVQIQRGMDERDIDPLSTILAEGPPEPVIGDD
jgi:c-di-GMP-binding flagellar brake protein YcgR